MQPLRIVDRFDERFQVHQRIFECSIFLQIHLLVLQRLEETLCLGILVRIPSCRHADPRADRFEPFHVRPAHLLHAAIRMMNHSRRRFSPRQSHLKRRQRQLGVNPARERPADTAARIGIEDRREGDEGRQQANLRNVRDPCLIRCIEDRSFDEIRIRSPIMAGIGRRHKPPFQVTKQGFFPHHP